MTMSANKLPATAHKRLSLPGAVSRPSAIAYAFIAPALIIVAAISLYPILYEIWLSFHDWDLLKSPTATFAGLAGYHRLADDGVFWHSFGRTVLWTVGTVVIEYVVAMPVALLLNRRSAVNGLLTGVLLLPWVTPSIVAAYTWQWLLDSQSGTFHYALHRLGIVGDRSLLTSPRAALWILIVISAWKGIPFMAVALLASMKAIAPELYEAAAIDGAGRFRQFRDITLPLLRGVSAVMSLILGIFAFYSFDLVWVITKGGPGDSTQLLGVYLFRLFFERVEFSYAATIGVAMLLLLIVFSLVYLRLLGQRET